MKPAEMRAMRFRQQAEAAARGEALEAFLRGGNDTSTVRPEMIPTQQSLTDALREYRRCARRAAGERGVKRARLIDELMIALATIVYIERVLEVDVLERAALTPARLVALSRIGPDDLRERLARFQGESEVELP